jgi:hypothetical protein
MRNRVKSFSITHTQFTTTTTTITTMTETTERTKSTISPATTISQINQTDNDVALPSESSLLRPTQTQDGMEPSEPVTMICLSFSL